MFKLAPDETIDAALEKMKVAGLRIAFVFEKGSENVLGMITAYDIMGEKPMRYLQDIGLNDHHITRKDIKVQDILDPVSTWVTATLHDVERTTVDAWRKGARPKDAALLDLATVLASKDRDAARRLHARLRGMVALAALVERLADLDEYTSRYDAAMAAFVAAKGPEADLKLAHQLCQELGLVEGVTWHQPVSLAQLLDMYEQSDVCIDQVGNHWMGAIGFHALYMGRPLIANARPDVFERQWGRSTPILQATTEGEIVEHLIRCEDLAFRERVALEGHKFAVENLDAESVYQRMRSSIMKDWCTLSQGPATP